MLRLSRPVQWESQATAPRITKARRHGVVRNLRALALLPHRALSSQRRQRLRTSQSTSIIAPGREESQLGGAAQAGLHQNR